MQIISGYYIFALIALVDLYLFTTKKFNPRYVSLLFVFSVFSRFVIPHMCECKRRVHSTCSAMFVFGAQDQAWRMSAGPHHSD